MNMHTSTSQPKTWDRPLRAPEVGGNKSQVDVDLWRELVDRIISVGKTYGWTKAEVARRIGMPDGTFSQYYSGKYEGRLDTLNEKVAQWLDALQETAGIAATIPQSPPYMPLRGSLEIIETLTWAQLAPDLVMITLGAGMGKTATCRQFARTRPHVYHTTVTESTKTVHGMLVELAEQLEVREHNPARLARAIGTRLRRTGGGTLLIVDEGQHLDDAALNQLRYFVDVYECGVAVVGNSEVYSRFTKHRTDRSYAQLKSRIGKRLHRVQPYDEDLAACIAAWNVTDPGAGLNPFGTSSQTTGSITRLLNPANSNSALAGDIGTYAKAIKNIESGGNYSALGPVLKNGDRALGAYQVMSSNVPSWTKGALGYSMGPSQFLASPTAQDAVFSKYFGASLAKYGNPQDAASIWFTGRPLAQGAGAADILGTTGSSYVAKFNSQLSSLSGAAASATGGIGGLGSATDVATKGLTSFGGGLDQFGNKLASSLTGGGASASGGGGGLFGGLFSGIGKLLGFGGSSGGFDIGSNATPVTGFDPLQAYANLRFDSGGYTGPGGKYEPAGIVHKGEVVFSQADVARNGGVAVVDAIRLGKRWYADGGAVDVKPMGLPRSAANNGNAAGLVHRTEMNVSLDVAGADSKDAEAAGYAGMKRALEEFSDHVLPGRVQEINEKPRWR